MKIKWDEQDIVVAASAYGHRVVRVENVDVDPTYLLVEQDGDLQDFIAWKGSLESCLVKMAGSEQMEIALATEPILRTPDEALNTLIERV